MNDVLSADGLPLFVGQRVFVVGGGKIRERIVGRIEANKIHYDVPDEDGAEGARINATTFVSFTAAAAELELENG